jgi:hypothetical protein
LYGGETWSHTKRQEHRSIIKNKALKRIFGPKRVEVVGDWTRNIKIYTHANGYREKKFTYSECIQKYAISVITIC